MCEVLRTDLIELGVGRARCVSSSVSSWSTLRSHGLHTSVSRPRLFGLTASTLRSHGLDRQNSTPLLGQLGPRLRVRVEQREVRDDHRNRKCYRQHAGQGAQRADEHAEVGLRHHVTVADRRHRYNRPPQAHRDGGEVEVESANEVKI